MAARGLGDLAAKFCGGEEGAAANGQRLQLGSGLAALPSHPLETLVPRLQADLAEERRRALDKDEEITALKNVVLQLERGLEEQTKIAKLQAALSAQEEKRRQSALANAPDSDALLEKLTQRLADLEVALAQAQDQREEACSESKRVALERQAGQEALQQAQRLASDREKELEAMHQGLLDAKRQAAEEAVLRKDLQQALGEYKDRCAAAEQGLRDQALELCDLRRRFIVEGVASEDTQSLTPTQTPSRPCFEKPAQVTDAARSACSQSATSPPLTPPPSEAAAEERAVALEDSPRLALAEELTKSISAQSELMLAAQTQLLQKEKELASLRAQLNDEQSLHALDRARARKALQRKRVQLAEEEKRRAEEVMRAYQAAATAVDERRRAEEVQIQILTVAEVQQGPGQEPGPARRRQTSPRATLAPSSGYTTPVRRCSTPVRFPSSPESVGSAYAPLQPSVYAPTLAAGSATEPYPLQSLKKLPLPSRLYSAEAAPSSVRSSRDMLELDAVAGLLSASGARSPVHSGTGSPRPFGGPPPPMAVLVGSRTPPTSGGRPSSSFNPRMSAPAMPEQRRPPGVNMVPVASTPQLSAKAVQAFQAKPGSARMSSRITFPQTHTRTQL